MDHLALRSCTVSSELNLHQMPTTLITVGSRPKFLNRAAPSGEIEFSHAAPVTAPDFGSMI